MRLKIILGVIGLVLGIGLFTASDYITKQVAIGRGEIAQYQAQVNTANTLIDRSSKMEGLGGVITSPAQEKLDQGTQKANYYAKLASRLHTAGAAIFLLSAAFIAFVCFRCRKK